MKYGIPRDKDGNYNLDGARAFEDTHWQKMISNMTKSRNHSWVQYPKKKVFISFMNDDRDKMKRLKRAMTNSELMKPHIVEDQRKGALNLSELVKQEIVECDFFVPILSELSIKSQWVNQEIGFATAHDHIEIIPLVQNSIMEVLKGFIHKEIQLSYNFDEYEDSKKSRSSFRNAYKGVISYIESKLMKDIDHSHLKNHD